MKRGWTWIVLCMLAMALVMSAGCQKTADSTTQTAPDDAAETEADAGDDAVVEPESEDEPEADEAELPNDFPPDIPIYENSSIESVFSDDVEGGRSHMVGMKSEDDAAEIYDWYKKAFEDGGWELTGVMDVGDSVGGFNATKDGTAANLSIGYGAEKIAQITMVVSPAK